MTQTYPINIEGHQLGNKKALMPTRQINLPGDWFRGGGELVTLRQLITRVVTEEVEAFREQQAKNQLFRVLTAEQIEEGKRAGRIDPAGKEHHQTINRQAAVTTALQAFEAGLYLVFIDGSQKKPLDETVFLAADSTLKFLRLIPLTGGIS